MMENFQRACDWLEPEIVLHSVKETQDKMKEQVTGQVVYGVQYIKSLLTNRYQNHIYFCNEPGRENIIYFKEMADYLINEKYKGKKTTVQEESKRIQTLAANLIKTEIREREFNEETYPSVGDIANLTWSPPLLRHFLKGLINSELKQESLVQCIVKAVKKDTIPSLLFGLVVDLDRAFGSKGLLRHLSRLGLLITPDEVTLYRQSVLEASIALSTTLQNGAFIQWSTDNVDHNLATLGGKGTFHGMGILAAVIPFGSFSQLTQITRLKEKKPADEIVKNRRVPIFNYDCPATLERFPKISSLKTRKVRDGVTFDLESELFWHLSWYFSLSIQPRTLWSGFMQSRFSKTEYRFYQKSDVILLPIIDHQPTNLACIYSTLLFIQS